MKHLQRMTWFLIAAIAVFPAVSCSKGSAERSAAPSEQPKPAEKKGKIGVTCMDLTNPFFKLIANVMTEEAAKYGYEVVSLDGNLDPAKQNSQLADFAAQGFDAVFLNPVDSNAAGEGVKKVHAAGIPVFTYDVEITDPDAREMIVSHIGSDNFQGGLLAAESMMKATGDQGKIAIISYPEVTSCILRVAGFKDHLKKHRSKLEIVTELSAKGNRNDGYAVAVGARRACRRPEGGQARPDHDRRLRRFAGRQAGRLRKETLRFAPAVPPRNGQRHGRGVYQVSGGREGREERLHPLQPLLLRDFGQRPDTDCRTVVTDP
ncbi:MAG: substrate-binding domain-containing protein [Pirellulales bacterium]|nr:substrate-binding domain-containing protein [Pirellulales bacterium]